MALKRIIHEICPKCGQIAARREGDRIRGWHDCPNAPPGPRDPPINFHVSEVTFVPAGRDMAQSWTKNTIMSLARDEFGAVIGVEMMTLTRTKDIGSLPDGLRVAAQALLEMRPHTESATRRGDAPVVAESERGRGETPSSAPGRGIPTSVFTCLKCEANYHVPEQTNECPVCDWRPHTAGEGER